MTILDVKCTPKTMANSIAECETVLSSSLHGLIFADSLGIPNKWITFEKNLIGGCFKFDDYYSCFEEENIPWSIHPDSSIGDMVKQVSLRDSTKVATLKGGILDALNRFVADLR